MGARGKRGQIRLISNTNHPTNNTHYYVEFQSSKSNKTNIDGQRGPTDRQREFDADHECMYDIIQLCFVQ